MAGKERADKLTREAVISQGKVMDRSDKIAALRDAGRIEEQKTTSSTNRLIELGAKRGVARHEHLVATERKVVNEHKTGVISRGTLRILLGRRSEHL